MGSKWKVATLSDYASILTGPFGSQLHNEDYVEHGTPIITVEHLGENRIIHKNLPCVSETDKKRLKRYSLAKGDVVFSRVGSVDRRAYVHDDEEGWLFSGRCLRVRVTHQDLDSRFLSYFFGLESVKEHIRSIAVGATMPSLNTKLLGSIQIPLPPPSEQQRIASILGSLDDKIEINRQMTSTLEAISQALFKSWFVDFDPVKAKSAGQPSVLPPRIDALFPDSLENSELGLIPKGWSVTTVGDIGKIVGGGTPSTQQPEYWVGGHHAFCTPKDLSSNSSMVLVSTERKVTDAGLLKIGSGLLPKGTVIMSSRAPIGYLAITDIPVCVNQGIIAIYCGEEVQNVFMIQWLRANMDTIKSRANGSTFLEISKANFRPIPFLVPTSDLLSKFTEFVTGIHFRIIQLEYNNQSLKKTRDALLHRFIGQEQNFQGITFAEGSQYD